ncbi:MAG: hemerythrin domain-containing protein [Metallibacterium sp.]
MESIEQIMRHDHERLDVLLETGAKAVHEGHWREAADLLQRFRHGLVDGHMVVEETLLFPAFETQPGNAEPALTAILRKGHQDLRVFIQEMAEAIAAHDDEEFAALLRTVRALLKQHDSKEESELYPHLAAIMPDQGRAASELLLSLQ